ncbi:hypothetical protein OUZ56_010338 [Daphnia magna]|uniref:Uncharacterized protein n=1 Tax=Daphnia magna TaxID=35525 RepID=A0ABR0AI91_9CRUS|nr:hypothetical protein OUZ56_010338 [Daphnia magna]
MDDSVSATTLDQDKIPTREGSVGGSGDRKFTLYDVIILSRPIGNATLGAQFEPLPPFLGVTSDGQAFVELTVSDSSYCVASTTSICPISRAVNRKDREPSCAMAQNEMQSRVHFKTRL